MTHEQWMAVDEYLTDLLVPPDTGLEHVLEASSNAGLPPHDVTPTQGKLLFLLARIQGAHRILEIGTLAGYSTIWLARALPPGGRVITLESNAKHAELARKNIEFAGVRDRVEIRLGPALQTLAALSEEGADPFDFIFIDADKPNNPAYFSWALQLSRTDTVIVVDNVVRKGAVIDASSEDPRVQGTRRFMESLAGEDRVSATALQTVGSKGYDGFVIAVVTQGS